MLVLNHSELIAVDSRITNKMIFSASKRYSRQFSSLQTRLLVSLRPYVCPFLDIFDVLPHSKSILDIGCGNGLWLYLVHLYAKPKLLVGVDTNNSRINSAQNAFLSLGVQSQLSVSRDPSYWPPGQYDVVSLIDVLHHIPREQQELFFRSVADKVKSGGVLIYKDMAVRPWWQKLANQLHDLVFARQWINHINIDKVEFWARDSSLNLENSVNRSTYWYAHELRLFRRIEQ